jgi:hypothetical protein
VKQLAIVANTETMPFKPGTSGNPGGRPKKTETLLEVEALARKYAPQALDVLLKIATEGKSDSARVAAATAILDRAFGRPRQTLQAQNESNVQYFISDKPLTAEEWRQSIAPGIEHLVVISSNRYVSSCMMHDAAQGEEAQSVAAPDASIRSRRSQSFPSGATPTRSRECGIVGGSPLISPSLLPAAMGSFMRALPVTLGNNPSDAPRRLGSWGDRLQSVQAQPNSVDELGTVATVFRCRLGEPKSNTRILQHWLNNRRRDPDTPA